MAGPGSAGKPPLNSALQCGHDYAAAKSRLMRLKTGEHTGNKAQKPEHSPSANHVTTAEVQAPGIPLQTPTLTLDVGCGIRKQPGAIGIDRNPASRPDVLADLEKFPYPFRDNSFDRITAIHVIEHLSDVIRTMEEFHRLLKPGGTLRIETPHYTDYSSFCDPTHKNHLNSFSFRYFGENHGGFGYYSQARFREISVRVKLLSFWKWLGFEFLVNHFPRYRRFWEHYLCYIVRGKAMEFEFVAEK
jgi:SAM-dependent methyltransferase